MCVSLSVFVLHDNTVSHIAFTCTCTSTCS